MASSTDKLSKSSNGGIPAAATVTASRAAGVTNLSVDTTTFWPTDTGIKFSTYKVDPSKLDDNGNPIRIPSSQIDWKGVVTGTTINNLVRTGGAVDTGNAVGDRCVMLITAQWGEDLVEALLAIMSQTGALLPSAVQTAIGTGGITTSNLAPGSVTNDKVGIAAVVGTNSGTAGGSTNLITTANYKKMWGTTALQTINQNGSASLTVTFPTAFTAVPEGFAVKTNLGGVAEQNVWASLVTTTGFSINFQNPASTGAGTVKAYWEFQGN